MKVDLVRTEEGIFLCWEIEFSQKHSCVHWILLEDGDLRSVAMSFGYPDDLPDPKTYEARDFLIDEIENFGDDSPSVGVEKLSKSLQKIIRGKQH